MGLRAKSLEVHTFHVLTEFLPSRFCGEGKEEKNYIETKSLANFRV